MYPLSFFCTRNKNHVPDELKRLEKLPQGLRKANACGGGVRPNEPLGVRAATSNEAGKPTREGGNPPAFAVGRCHDPSHTSRARQTPFLDRLLIQALQ